MGQFVLQFGESLEGHGGIHGSMRVPPHEVAIRPTGRSSFWWISRPKKYSTAEKTGTVLGSHSTHWATTSFAGVPDGTSGDEEQADFGEFRGGDLLRRVE